MSGIADMEALNQYFATTPIKTSKAAKLKDEWRAWYDSLGFFSLRSDQTYDEARNKRYAFNMANSVNDSERQAVRDQQQHGLSTEETRGQTDRRLSDGTYATPPPPLLSAKTKIILVLTAIIGGAGYVAKKIYLDPFISTFKRP